MATSPGRPAVAPSGGAGIGGRGPGETKLETDRRRIHSRIAKLRATLREMDANRQIKRAERRRHQVPSVAIVGYTNAGKSSLLNRLTGAGVLVEDALFATLDPTTRRTQTADGRVFTLTDTVGFVRHLPHDLVEAFASTLEESAQADLLVHVVDASDPDPVGQIKAVRGVLADIGAGDVPELMVLNKCRPGQCGGHHRPAHRSYPGAVVISARTGEGIEELRAVVESRLPRPEREVRVLLPYERGDLVNRIHAAASCVSMRAHRARFAGDRPGPSGPGRRAGAVRARRLQLSVLPMTASDVGAPKAGRRASETLRAPGRAPTDRGVLAAAVAEIGGHERPGQLELAAAVADALRHRRSTLLAQAGTGHREVARLPGARPCPAGPRRPRPGRGRHRDPGPAEPAGQQGHPARPGRGRGRHRATTAARDPQGPDQLRLPAEGARRRATTRRR